MRFVVLIYNSFAPDTPAYHFDDYEVAKKYLEELWQEGLNIEFTENSDVDMEKIYHEEDNARIQWSNGEFSEYILIEPTEPIKIGK